MDAAQIRLRVICVHSGLAADFENLEKQTKSIGTDASWTERTCITYIRGTQANIEVNLEHGTSSSSHGHNTIYSRGIESKRTNREELPFYEFVGKWKCTALD